MPRGRYVLLTTDVGGEARFASAVARRLQALGALTKGDRRAEIGALDSFNFDTMWGKRALRMMLSGCYEGTSSLPVIQAALASDTFPSTMSGLEAIGVGSAAERDKLEVKRFLNRLLGLPLTEQTLLFDLFASTLQSVIEAARRDGKYDEGIADLSGASVSLEEPEGQLWRDPLTGATTRSAVLRVDRGVSFEEATLKLEEAGGRALADEAKRAAERKARAATKTRTRAPTSADAEAVGGGEEEGGGGMVDLPDADEDDEDDDEEGGEDEMDEEDRAFIVDDDDEDEDEQEEEEEDDDDAGDGGEDGVEAAAADEKPADEGADEGAGDATQSEEARAAHAAGARAGAGFYKSRFLQAGERLYVLVVPRANRKGQFYLTRPATGLSPFEEDEYDLRRKYAPSAFLGYLTCT